ncbi:MAG: YncE family protein [Longimicrobiales bacterium]
MRVARLVVAAMGVCAAPGAVGAQAPERDYLVFVASEATDRVALIRFGPAGARIERTRDVGFNPSEPDGPHGLAVAPGGRHYFVSTAHGAPNGYLWKLTTVGDTVLGHVELGSFPASLQISPDGHYAYVVNFNLYGEMTPSSVSVVSTASMQEVARLQTCAMPHGSRFNASGSKHYSVCMMDEMLIEIDPRQLAVARHFMLSRGNEHGSPGEPRHGMSGGHAAGGHAMDAPAAGNTKCSPTWVAPSPDGARAYVACNAANDIVELDVASWRLLRRIPAGNGVYNLAVTRDGRQLVATNKRDQSVSIIDAASGKELARVPTQRTVVQGVAISDDDRYAFISVEGVGSQPGTVEMIDLRTHKRVAAVDVGQMAGGIDFWKSEPSVGR